MDAPFTAAVVGLGRIGQGYDQDRHAGDTTVVLTHAAAFAAHPGFALAAGVDADPDARERFERRFGKPAYATVGELHATHAPDVVALAVPTAAHLEVATELLHHKPQALLCEKPLAATPQDGEALIEAAEAAGTSLLVNYLRRFDPGIEELRGRLQRGELGRPYKAAGWYSRNLLEMGSHLVDLVLHLCGGPAEVLWSSADRDGPQAPDAVLDVGGTRVHLLAARDDPAPIFELELVCERAVVRLRDGGASLRIHATRPSATFAGEQVLDEEGEELRTDLGRYQWHVAAGVEQHLRYRREVTSTGRTALETLRACAAIAAPSRRDDG